MSEGSGRVEIVIKGARFTEADAEAQVHGICFKTGPPQRVGVELEWLARDRRDPALPVQAEQVTATLAGFGPEARSGEEGYPGQEAQTVRYQPFSLPSGASLTVEPGGQLELSSAPAATLDELVEVTGRDLAALRDAAAAAGLELCGYGLDPLRPPRRLLDLPRYAAMEKFFDRDGPWGRAGRGDLPRLAARRRLGDAAGAPRRGSGLSPVHAVPAGPPAGAHGAADDRRAARRRLDRARGRGHGAGRRRPGGRRRAGRGRAGVGRTARCRGPVAAGGVPRPGRPADQPGQQAVLRGRRRRARPAGRARRHSPGSRRLHRALRAEGPMSRRRPTGGSPMTEVQLDPETL